MVFTWGKEQHISIPFFSSILFCYSREPFWDIVCSVLSPLCSSFRPVLCFIVVALSWFALDRHTLSLTLIVHPFFFVSLPCLRTDEKSFFRSSFFIHNPWAPGILFTSFFFSRTFFLSPPFPLPSLFLLETVSFISSLASLQGKVKVRFLQQQALVTKPDHHLK